MRPADIDRTDRKRLLASLAVTAVFYTLLFAVLLAFDFVMPAGGSLPGRKGSMPISIRLAADSERRTGSSTISKNSVRRESRRASASALSSQKPLAAASQSPSAKPDLPADAAISGSGSDHRPGNEALDWTATGDTGSGEAEKGTGDAAGSGTAEDGIGAADATAGPGALIGGISGGTPAFIAWLDQAIRTKLAYPDKARNRNIEGTVTILAEVSADGQKCMASIRQSSGSSILDRAAVSFVKSLFPSPVSPRKTFSGTVRIRYILTQEGT